MPEPIPVVIDTDIGADPDDALVLSLALAAPELEVLGMAGRQDIPVFVGDRPRIEPDGRPNMLDSEGQGVLDYPYDGPEATILQTSAPA